MSKLIAAEWADKLSSLTDNEIKRGLDALSGDFPPSLPKFVETCRDGWAQRTDAYKPFKRLLPKPKARQKVVNDSLCKMRKALGQAGD